MEGNIIKTHNRSHRESYQLEVLEGRILLSASSFLDDVALSPGIGNGDDLPALGEIHGTKWDDRNGNAQRDPDEPGLAGVTIYADLNQNSILDPNEPHTSTLAEIPETDFDEGGRYWLSGLEPGSYVIREIVPDSHFQTHPGVTAQVIRSDTSAIAQEVALDYDLTGVSAVQGNATILSQIDLTVIWPDSCGNIISNMTTHSVNGNQITVEMFGKQVGTICAEMISPQTETIFVGGLAAQEYVVVATLHEILPSSSFHGNIFVETLVVEGEFVIDRGGHHVVLEPGQMIGAIDFGNQPLNPQPGSIHGLKWADTNGNAIQDPNESGLPGVVIYLDLNHNGVLDANDRYKVTLQDNPNTAVNESGRYWFHDLTPGRYTVREVVPDGFVQTFPDLPFSGTIDAASRRKAFSTVDPAMIHVSLAPGETFYTQVSVTLHPLCLRPFKVDVEVSDPDVAFMNHTGILSNGCRGETSTFEISLVGDEFARHFDLQFVNARFGSVFAEIPVWISVTDQNGAHVVDVGSGNVVRGINFGNQPITASSIHGTKWDDRNGNAKRDPGEPGLADVTIYADLNENGILDSDEPYTNTLTDIPETDFDEGGRYRLGNLKSGTYMIREIVPDGFTQTFPRDESGPTPPGPGPLEDEVSDPFAEVRPATIDLALPAGETTNQEVSITILPNLFRAIEVDVVASVSDVNLVNQTGTIVNGGGGDTSVFDVMFTGDGLPHAFDLQFVHAEFGGVTGPVIPVRINSPESSGAHRVVVRPGQAIEGIDFGNQKIQLGSIHGTKWEDRNGNAKRDPDEPGLAGITIYADLNQNGILDPDEPHTKTMGDDPVTDFDESGQYGLTDLPAGEHYVNEVVPFGFVQTYPSPVGIPIYPPPHATTTSVTHLDAVQQELNTQRQQWQTLNLRDYIYHFERICFCSPEYVDPGLVHVVGGEIDSVEHAMTGDVLDPSLFLTVDDLFDEVQAAIDSNADEISVQYDGILGNPTTIDIDFSEYIADEEMSFRASDLRVIPDPGIGAHKVILEPGDVVEGIDFGNQKLEPGSIHGIKWEDRNGNAKRDPDEPGLAGITIYVDLNQNGILDPDEPHTSTLADIPETDFDEGGGYRFSDLEAGTYVIREVVPDDFTQTFPVGPILLPAEDGLTRTEDLTVFPPVPTPGAHVVVVENGQIVEGLDFGNQRIEPGSVHGIKWLDKDGNGHRSDGEPSFPGVVIYSDLNFNGKLDPDEPRTMTRWDDPATDFDETGHYWLEGLQPGFHLICEVVPMGFLQTFPRLNPTPLLMNDVQIFMPPGSHFAFVSSGGAIDGLDFGNRLYGDANHDGKVSGQDVILIQENYGKTIHTINNSGGSISPPLVGDANGDGKVDGADIISVVNNFGHTVATQGGPIDSDDATVASTPVHATPIAPQYALVAPTNRPGFGDLQRWGLFSDADEEDPINILKLLDPM